jgi:hypothetical protein
MRHSIAKCLLSASVCSALGLGVGLTMSTAPPRQAYPSVLADLETNPAPREQEEDTKDCDDCVIVMAPVGNRGPAEPARPVDTEQGLPEALARTLLGLFGVVRPVLKSPNSGNRDPATA